MVMRSLEIAEPNPCADNSRYRIGRGNAREDRKIDRGPVPFTFAN